MNYRHAYHAGNFADVFKHIILCALTKSFLTKETPFCFLETHGGTGSYDLSSHAAKKNNESQLGIAKIFAEKQVPPLVEDYLSCVQQLNQAGKLRFYPGSPYYVRQLIRPQDRMILCELQRDEYISLKKFFKDDKKMMVQQQDGYQGLSAFLPPKERRGLVFIDPPYEKQDELFSLVTELVKTIQRFETGVYAIWYPIKTRREINLFHQAIQAKISRTTLVAELSIFPENLASHLNGCGMLIINPPWQLEQQLQELLPWLLSKLNVTEGHSQVKLLVP